MWYIRKCGDIFRNNNDFQGLHSASVPGILAVDVCLRDTSKIVTGGNDKNVTVFNKDTGQVVSILEGHTKKVTSVLYHPEEVGLTIISSTPTFIESTCFEIPSILSPTFLKISLYISRDKINCTRFFE